MIKNSKIRLFIRFIVKKFLPLLGFNNLLLIFERQISSKDLQSNFQSEFNLVVCNYPFSLSSLYRMCGELPVLVNRFDERSVLIVTKDQEQIIGYMWAHFDFDPLHEIQTDYTKFVVIGPAFVKESYRGQNLSKAMRSELLKIIIEKNYNTIISKAAFDNIPQIKAAIKAGYKIHKIMYKIDNNRYYI
ncbi:GNAT family N-acetyltransferase [Balneolales bacterium ANBcel1]|nr:GNAT family N-acetyltransferase [Balneolales bacterium ANBcel1]